MTSFQTPALEGGGGKWPALQSTFGVLSGTTGYTAAESRFLPQARKWAREPVRTPSRDEESHPLLQERPGPRHPMETPNGDI